MRTVGAREAISVSRNCCVKSKAARKLRSHATAKPVAHSRPCVRQRVRKRAKKALKELMACWKRASILEARDCTRDEMPRTLISLDTNIPRLRGRIEVQEDHHLAAREIVRALLNRARH